MDVVIANLPAFHAGRRRSRATREHQMEEIKKDYRVLDAKKCSIHSLTKTQVELYKKLGYVVVEVKK